MDNLHSLLKRQLRRCFGSEEQVPAGLDGFIKAVNDAYSEFDTDRAMIERSLELSSHELLQANSDLGAVLEAFLDLFFHVDQDGVILAYRVGTSADAVISPDQFIGKRIQDVPMDNAGEKFGDAIKRVHATGSLVRIEYTLQTNGQPQYYEANLLPLRNGEIAVIIRNITEQHLARQRELELQNRLARSERMESLGVLAGGVAHDLNNILGPIVVYPGIIMKMIPENEEAHGLLTEIEKSSHRAAAVIQDLLTLARRGNCVMEPVDVNELIENFTRSITFQELETQNPLCKLSMQLGDNLPPALGIQHQLSQAVMNLIINAYESIPAEGCVSVTTECKEVEEHEGIYAPIRAGTYVIIKVRDTGTGIPEESIEHIFEPFYSKKTMGRSGSGLGLTVVYGVVRDMKGYVDIDTKDAEGTEMRLYIPASDSRIYEEETDKETDLSGNARILVVDDVPEQRKLVETVLSSLGYEVETAPNGHEAVDRVHNQPVDLIVMDMIMEEGFDGLDAYKAILEIHPNQKCLIVSGFSDTDRVNEALRCGAGGFLSKPYSIALLGKMVRQELDRIV